MKKLILFLIIFKVFMTQAQEVFQIGLINFEDTLQMNYIDIDNDSIWFIGEPHKEYLYIPENYLFLGDNVLFTDTNQYYGKNIHTSFQFKIKLSGISIYVIEFNQVYDFETNKDGGIIETSWDNGQTWQNIIFDSRIMDNIWNTYINLYSDEDTIAALNNEPGFTGLFSEVGEFNVAWYVNEEVDTLILRFTFASDSVDAQNEGWMLDNFRFQLAVEDQIKDNKLMKEVGIYPNPAVSELNFSTNFSIIKRIEVISVMGKSLYMEEGNDLKMIDVSFLVPGLYFIRCITDKNQPFVVRFQKL